MPRVLTSFLVRCHRVTFPALLLVAFLLRLPIPRLLSLAGQILPGPAVGTVMRSSLIVGALGALHSRAGATTFVQSPGNPVNGTVGAPLSIAFTYTGTPTSPSQFIFTGTLPPGLSFLPAPTGNTIPSGTPAITGTPTTAGSFTVRVQGFNPQGLTDSVLNAINFVIASAGTGPPPTITGHPLSVTVVAGQKVALLATATAAGSMTYQWSKTGSGPIPGATNPLLVLSGVTSANSGNYTCAVTSAGATATTNAGTVTVLASSASPGYIRALSLRGNVGAGADVFVVGFVLEGAGGRILVKSVGPGLAALDVPGAMADPRLDLTVAGSNLTLGGNDNWGGGADLIVANAEGGAFPLADPASRDAVLLRSLSSGVYLATASGVGNTTGVSLVEFYGLNNPANLYALSLRGRIGTGADIFVAGFVIAGSTAKTVLIKVVGPGLIAHNVPGSMADPQLDLTVAGSNAFLGSNDNWGGTADLVAANTAASAFPLTDLASKDAMMFITLPPGVYLATARGAAETTGVALLEFYGQ